MSPDTLASLLAADPYPGCTITRPGGAVRLDFDGLILRYQRDGWHFGDAHLESTLSEHGAPEQVHPEIRRILKVVMSLKAGRALGEAETLRSEDPVEYLTSLAAEKMLSILDVTALANARQAKIASNVADLAARDMRIADLEATIEGAHKVLDGAGVTWSTGNNATRLPLATRAALAVEPGAFGVSESRLRIAELERDLADKAASLKTAHAALKRICEVIGAPVPCVAEDAVEAVKRQLGDDNDANNRAQKAEATIAEMVKALDDAGAPQAYHLEDGTERGIPDPERIRLLGERVHTLRAQIREVADATNYLNALIEAHNALDGLGAPRLADGCVLSLAARIRSIPL